MNLSIFNPAHANGLTDEQIISMQSLTEDQIKELASLFPNKGINTAYLVLKDKTKADADQIKPLSTWQNLHNLHRAGLKHFIAIGFRDRYQQTAGKAETAPLLDLTEEDIREAQGLKKRADADFVFPDDLDKIHPGFEDMSEAPTISELPGEFDEVQVPKEFQEESKGTHEIPPPAPIKRRGRPNKIQ